MNAASPVVPKLVPSKHENGAKTSDSDADRLTVIADLLCDLPAHQRAELIADLTQIERAEIARLLIGNKAPEAKR